MRLAPLAVAADRKERDRVDHDNLLGSGFVGSSAVYTDRQEKFLVIRHKDGPA
jgi:hypothetical protein